MDKITFREPKINDLKSTLEMINSLVDEKAYITVQKKLTIKEEKEYLKKVAKEIENKNAVYLNLDINGKVRGNARVSLIDSGPRKHMGELGISIMKEARGRGLGEKLFKKIVEKAVKELKVKIITLYVVSKNKVAINLYKKMGFKKISTIKKGYNHYGELLDNITMIKYI